MYLLNLLASLFLSLFLFSFFSVGQAIVRRESDYNYLPKYIVNSIAAAARGWLLMVRDWTQTMKYAVITEVCRKGDFIRSRFTCHYDKSIGRSRSRGGIYTGAEKLSRRGLLYCTLQNNLTLTDAVVHARLQGPKPSKYLICIRTTSLFCIDCVFSTGILTCSGGQL